jgi:hypothetical protein
VTIRLKTDPHKKAAFAEKIGGLCANSHLIWLNRSAANEAPASALCLNANAVSGRRA